MCRGRERATALCHRPFSQGFRQDGQETHQFESCKGRPGSGKETRPHWRVQRSSHLCTVSLASTLGVPRRASTSPWGLGWVRASPMPLHGHDSLMKPQSGAEGRGGGSGEPPLTEHVLHARHCAALQLLAHTILIIAASGRCMLFPFYK